jgi:hypothetical protein
MFVRSNHYSDYLEHDLCIQDKFTISTSPCIMPSHWCLAVRGKKLLRNIATGHNRTTKTCFNDVIVFSLHEVENLFGNLFAVNFTHVTCDAHINSQHCNHARKYSVMYLRRIFNHKKLTAS